MCSACEYKEVKDTKIDWKERQSLLKELCEKYRSRNGSYDVVVPGSGGKIVFSLAIFLNISTI